MPERARRTLRLAAALALALAGAAPAAAEGLAGAYLAARQASGMNDYRGAADYYARALLRDPANAMLLESAAIAELALGDLGTAVPIARQLRMVAPDNQVAAMVLLAERLVREDYEGALADYAGGLAVGPLVDGLVKGWTELALGDVSEALAAFDAVIANPGFAPFGAYHKALALAMVGDFEGADRLFAGDEGGGFAQTRRSAIAHVEVLGQLERRDEARKLLSDAFGADPDPRVAGLRAALEAGESPPFDVVTTPAEGLSEVFFTVAGALSGEAEDTYTLLYTRLAQALAPRHTDALLLSAAILERQGQFDLATAAYNGVPREDPAFHLAEMGRAEALAAAGRTEAALEVLEQLARSHPGIPDVHRALGDMLRGEKRYDEAAAAYDAAIAALPAEDPSHWVLYYVRGISHERGQRWDQAEADFRKALELSPDQPQVLNYLGYSYLEMHQNLDEALAMIERAVEQRPDDGYIVDSLGWALYRLGRFDEAVAPMERAAELMATDPIVNDHLGDVLWAVGRTNEAEFQWRRALSFDPEEKDALRIRRKLEVGLDAVLAEEGAKPISVANDQGG
jgi:tetratricopeptide (TPR) repeat protein